MEIEFIDPTPAMAAYQRRRSVAYMVQALRASSADLTSPRSVAVTLAQANFDPFLIGRLGGLAARIVGMQRAAH
ncbi:hypothetical protein [Mesorhizobium sp. M8A.F.Ca.ET.021.01.1.1]|uniref:hypothetical protein n=1 Tax=Mesorhizobium sp. M8A.F.Ca.ET.021.01.1.1 TaxID=2496757 RepID=UPI000FCB4667|nr:hypothetical protein [Mesorhizobium sp. M8A.F.Ca.ET.021.01.1.1]RUW55821.1 hypothetical protein EOA36_07090 [Mesorhizobium sp. M8A.F.Ca.ET.021.01.1.1]